MDRHSLTVRLPQALVLLLFGTALVGYALLRVRFQLDLSLPPQAQSQALEHCPLDAREDADTDYVLSLWRGQVHRQLSRLDTISWESLQEGEATLKRVRDIGIRVAIVDGRLYFRSIPTEDEEFYNEVGRNPHYHGFYQYTVTTLVALRQLLNARAGTAVENVVINFRFGDGCHDLDDKGLDALQKISSSSFAPLFSYTHGTSGTKACADIMFPSFDWVHPSQQFLPGSPYRLDSFEPVPWEKRKDVALFRGNLNTWDGARVSLLFASMTHPDLVDAKLVTIEPQQCERMKRQAVKQSFPMQVSENCTEFMGQYLTSEESLQYKYMIDIDGHGATFRHKNTLLGSFVMFKVDSEYNQFYYSSLEPWAHYIPVSRSNMAASLAQRVSWARAHDEECQKIADRSLHFAQDYLTFEKMQWYQAEVLRQYSRKLDFEPFVEEEQHEFCCSQLEKGPAQHFVKGLIPYCIDTPGCAQSDLYPLFIERKPENQKNL